jgi:hypothetical protein
VAKISPQKRNGKVVGYSVYLGTIGIKRRQRKFVTELADAEKLVQAHESDPRPVGELLNRKAELLYALEQIRHLRVKLPEVVTFYVRHDPTNGSPTLNDLVESFIAEKKRIGRSDHYERSTRYYLNRFMAHVGRDILILSVSRPIAREGNAPLKLS